MMEWTKEIQDALAAPFPEDEIEFLPRAASGGRALALAHIDARSVMRRLDAVVGPQNWQFDFEMLSPDGKKVKGKLTVLGVTKCDAGEADHEDEPLKAGVSDALKRCGVHFGIGRYLYYLPQLWADFDPQKRRFAAPPRLPSGAVERALAVCGYHANGIGAAVESRGDARVATAGRGRERAPKVTLEVTEGRPAEAPAKPARSPRVTVEKETVTASALLCADEECQKPLTKGQHDISLRAFGRPLCPGCQRQQARAA